MNIARAIRVFGTRAFISYSRYVKNSQEKKSSIFFFVFEFFSFILGRPLAESDVNVAILPRHPSSRRARDRRRIRAYDVEAPPSRRRHRRLQVHLRHVRGRVTSCAI